MGKDPFHELRLSAAGSSDQEDVSVEVNQGFHEVGVGDSLHRGDCDVVHHLVRTVEVDLLELLHPLFKLGSLWVDEVVKNSSSSGELNSLPLAPPPLIEHLPVVDTVLLRKPCGQSSHCAEHEPIFQCLGLCTQQ